MPNWSKQTRAASHIQELLQQRRLDISSYRLTLPNKQQWIIFEHKGKQLGIDIESGVWVRASEDSQWRCLARPCTVSGALQAVEFLSKY